MKESGAENAGSGASLRSGDGRTVRIDDREGGGIVAMFGDGDLITVVLYWEWEPEGLSSRGWVLCLGASTSVVMNKESRCLEKFKTHQHYQFLCCSNW
jgi:hypothetical protein